jgi:hypothetical protein
MTLAPFRERSLVLHTPLPYELLKVVALIVVALAIVGAIAQWHRRGLRPAVAFVVLYALYKVVFLTFGYFEWYGVPVLAVLFLLAAAGLDRIASLISGALRGRVSLSGAQLVAVPAVVLALAYAIQLPYAIPLEARVQNDIEDQVRVPLGQYLGRVVPPGQTLASESSGYVGYYTNGTLYDYPGLVSTTVVDSLRAHPSYKFHGVAGVSALLRPDWLILRPGDEVALKSAYPQVAREYRLARRFRAPGFTSLDEGGLTVANADSDFLVLRREPNAAR